MKIKKQYKKEYNILIFIIIIIVVVVIGYFTSTAKDSKKISNNDRNQQSQNKNSGNAVGGGPAEIKTTINYDGKIIFSEKKDNATFVYLKTSTDEKKLVFTDKDEEDKIKFFGGISDQGDILAVLALENQEFSGSLELIKTDGSGNRTKILDEFASFQAPRISPDARLISYILFSNAEIDYGFGLYVMNKLGQNKLKIDSDQTTINNIAWSQDSKKFCYIKGNNPKMQLFIADSEGFEQKKIYLIPADKTVLDLSWKSNSILVTLNSLTGTNESEIIAIDPDTAKIATILKTSDYIAESEWATNSNDKIFYLSAKNKEEKNNYQLNIADINGNSSNLGSAKSIIGWFK